MKSIELDTVGIGKSFKKQRKKMIISILIGIIFLYIGLAYLALVSRENDEMVSAREARKNELDIKFDKKLLGKLQNAGEAIYVNGSGSKNPFSFK